MSINAILHCGRAYTVVAYLHPSTLRTSPPEVLTSANLTGALTVGNVELHAVLCWLSNQLPLQCSAPVSFYFYLEEICLLGHAANIKP